jgi:hypothetical protein
MPPVTRQSKITDDKSTMFYAVLLRPNMVDMPDNARKPKCEGKGMAEFKFKEGVP